ncbi:hypothetical protein GJ744_003435 [Endocarpon pusillum]|uniref:Kinetochore protein fta7 n=1 Tax=Endocarpon pusillum TaxID=364733 RepID=A0A8H7A6U6_9EURO|nr:hypothetical protein GJ744_003435 [Endocarpon pusillum]
MAKSTAAAKSSRKQYARLAPRVKTLKEGAIRKKWRKLPVGTRAKVADLLRTIERPALTHGNNDRRGVEAQAFVSEFVEQLILRLPRMPFPPGTDELSFNFESTINRQRVLEEQLTANTHAVGLLTAEVGEETALLEREKEGLATLEKDLSDLERSEARQEQRLHPFAQANALETPPKTTVEYDARTVSGTTAPTVSDLDDDRETKDMLEQLRHHLDSMQNSVESTRDIEVALATSQAALGVFNWTRLAKDEYSQVYKMDAT